MRQKKFALTTFVFVVITAMLALFAKCEGQECFCGGLHDDGVRLAMTRGRTVTYFIGPGSMAGIDQKTTQRLFVNGMTEFGEVSALKMVRVMDKSKARIRIEFRNKEQMRAGSKDGKPLYSLGKAWSSGRIAINRDREIGNLANRRISLSLIQHETMHVLGWGHSNDVESVMHANASALYFSPSETRALQKKFGSPSREFFPKDRAWAGMQIKTQTGILVKLWSGRSRLIAARTQYERLENWAKMMHYHRQVLANLDQIIMRNGRVIKWNQEWHRYNRKWRGVPFAAYIEQTVKD